MFVFLRFDSFFPGKRTRSNGSTLFHVLVIYILQPAVEGSILEALLCVVRVKLCFYLP